MPPHDPKPISKLTFKPFPKKKRTEPRARRESRAGDIVHTTTLDRPIASNPSTHHNPRSYHRTQPQHWQDRTHDPPMLDLSLSRSTSPFPSIVNHSLFLPLSPFHRIFEFNECFILIFVSFKFIIEIFYYEICCLEAEKIVEKM